MSTSSLVLNYLRVLLSAPVVAGVVSAFFLFLFKDQIRSLLTRIATIKWGGAELSAPQPPPSNLLSAADIPPSNESQQLIGPEVDATADSVDQRGIALEVERNHALLWEFRFLNYYLVPITQNVLDWFATLPTPTTFNMYNSLWQASVPVALERNNIIGALESHNLIEYSGDLIAITHKGRDYIRWRGPRFFPTPNPSAV